MSQKLILILMVFVFLFKFNFAFASLVINEVMYDLSGSDSTNSKSREWIEIYNPDSSDVMIDASKWRIYDGSANRTMNGEVNFSVSAGSYIILAGDKDTFILDHPGFSGVVYDTGITSLNNTGDILKILDQDGNIIDTVTYASSQGAAGDGNSLQKISGAWSGATPTPGVANEAIPPPPPAPDSGNPVSSSNGSSGSVLTGGTAETKKIAETPKIKTQIMLKSFGFVNIPISLRATTWGYSGEQLFSGKYFWNFGDGDSKEVKMADNQPFAHTYFYPGEYAISLDYYQNYYSDVPDTTNQIIIKITEAKVSISRVGDEKDFFIELSNETDFPVDLSNWFLKSDQKSFQIPKNTTLASKKKLIISPRISLFSIEDKNTLELITREGEIVSEIARQPAREPAGGDLTTKKVVSKTIQTQATSQEPFLRNTENLQASVINNNIQEQDITNPSSFPFIPAASFVFIGASAYAVYFIRRKKVISQTGDDFKILDE